MMPPIDPEKINTLKTALARRPVVNDTCIGCGSCIGLAGDVFAMNEEYMSTVKPLDNYEGKSVDEAIRACPVRAISWENL